VKYISSKRWLRFFESVRNKIVQNLIANDTKIPLLNIMRIQLAFNYVFTRTFPCVSVC
jgi:hypothetical protein